MKIGFPDGNNPHVLLGAWINTNGLQGFDHLPLIQVKVHGTTNTYRTICSFNDSVFSYHVGNEDSTAGTPRNLRHYQATTQETVAGQVGAISADLTGTNEAGFELDGARS